VRKRRSHGNPRIKDLGIATRFKPGQSGNPGGRPKTRELTEMLRAVCNEIDPKSRKSFFQLAAESLLREVFAGDVQAFKELADRVEGRTVQQVELSGPEGSAIPLANVTEIDERIAELMRRGEERALIAARA